MTSPSSNLANLANLVFEVDNLDDSSDDDDYDYHYSEDNDDDDDEDEEEGDDDDDRDDRDDREGEGDGDGSMLSDIQSQSRSCSRSHSQTPTDSQDRNDDDADTTNSVTVPPAPSSAPLPTVSQDDAIASATTPPPPSSSADDLPAIPSGLEAAGARVGATAGPPLFQLSVLANDDADDEDFDYLRESAFERDDPLEYRDDLTIPIKEVIQLLGHTDAPSTLRPQTRASASLGQKKGKKQKQNDVVSNNTNQQQHLQYLQQQQQQRAVPPLYDFIPSGADVRPDNNNNNNNLDVIVPSAPTSASIGNPVSGSGSVSLPVAVSVPVQVPVPVAPPAPAQASALTPALAPAPASSPLPVPSLAPAAATAAATSTAAAAAAIPAPICAVPATSTLSGTTAAIPSIAAVPAAAQPVANGHALTNVNSSLFPPTNTAPAAPVHTQALPLAPLPASTGTPPQVAYIPLPQQKVAEFHRQLSAHVQIATHLHFTLGQRAKQKQQQQSNTSEEDVIMKDADSDNDFMKSRQRIETMLYRLIEQGRSSDLFYTLTQSRIDSMYSLLQKICLSGTSAPTSSAPSSSSSASAPAPSSSHAPGNNNNTGNNRNNNISFHFRQHTPAIPIKLIQATSDYLTAIGGNNTDNGSSDSRILTDGALREYTSEALALTLRRRMTNRSQTGARGGAPEWSREDDVLLAMTVAKYGRDFNDLCKDLLPHRSVDDCQLRTRYLSSRRCGDNAVKRQVMILNSPLTRDELAKVDEALKRPGADPTEAETWKRIQRELLPGREWSHLQKLWNWRVHRRQYKANYRAKKQSKEKKKKES